MKYAFLLLMGTMIFFSCRFIGGKRVRGNGNVVTQERTIGGFEGVENYGSFDITLVPSTTTSIKIEAEENLQQYIETYVDHNKLQSEQETTSIYAHAEKCESQFTDLCLPQLPQTARAILLATAL